MERIRLELKDNPVFIESLVNSMDSPNEIVKLSQVSDDFYLLTVKNNLFWYYAIKKWFPNVASSKSVYNLQKDYRRTFALQLNIIF